MANSFSQHSEDDYVLNFFGHKEGGYFVEVGALDGVKYSNTLLLERNFNWRGLLVEADPTQAALAAANRPDSKVVPKAVSSPMHAGSRLPFTIVSGFEALSGFNPTSADEVIGRARSRGEQIDLKRVEVECVTLDDILTENNVPFDFEFMSIDIEGHEYEALLGMAIGTRWHPSLVLIENNHWRPSRDIRKLMSRAGYGYSCTIAGINEVWLPSDDRRLVAGLRHYWDYRGQLFRGALRQSAYRLGVLATLRRLRDRI